MFQERHFTHWQVATFHHEFTEVKDTEVQVVKAPHSVGTAQGPRRLSGPLPSPGLQHTWKLSLVQELCHASLADAIGSELLQPAPSRLVSILISRCVAIAL